MAWSSAETDVECYGAGEEIGVLGYETYACAVVGDGDGADVDSVEEDGAGGWVVEAFDEGDG